MKKHAGILTEFAAGILENISKIKGFIIMKESITFAGLTVPGGTKVSQYIEMPGDNYKIPVTIVNGVNDGKTFLITASIHGFEYPGIEASVELSKELDPKEVSGAIVIIPVVNASGFYGRLPYVCADDEERKNLNRLAPGDKNGTFGQRLIAYLTEEFVKKADFHIDLHSGDATEALCNFAAAGNAQDEETKKLIHDVIHHTSYNYYTQSSGKSEFYNGSVYYNGVPSMMFEVGGAGVWNREEVDEEKENLKRIAQYFKILPGEPELNREQVWLTKQSWIECEADGLFYKFVKCGDEIKEGQKIYEIRDVFGNLIAEHFALHDGKVMILNNTLGVSKGDDAVFYGKA